MKREDLQHTGSFKLRGALNAVLSLDPRARRRGVVVASTGNHGLAVTHALAIAGVRGTIVVPRTIDPAKRARLERAGAKLLVCGDDSVETEAAARAIAANRRLHYVSPYNDAAVVAGQGTLGLEILEDLPDVDAVFVAVGGGGLISGVAAAIKSARRSARVYGCIPARSPFMSRSVRAGRILGLEEVDSGETLSDATAGGIEERAITFDLCRELVDEFVEVGEDEIRRAMATLLFDARAVVEGAAAVALAGWSRKRRSLGRAKSVVLLCGANVDPALIRKIARAPARRA